MFDKSFPNSCIRQRNVKSDTEGVRVLRSFPDGIVVQFRRKTKYVQVYLSFLQARELALAVNEAYDE